MSRPLSPDAGAARADAVAEAVLRCPDVVALSGGRVGEVATYLPGRRIAGVRVAADGALTVHVVGRYGPTVDQLAAQVRAAVLAAVGPAAVHVGVDDLVVQPARPGARSVVPPLDPYPAGRPGRASPAP